MFQVFAQVPAPAPDSIPADPVPAEEPGFLQEVLQSVQDALLTMGKDVAAFVPKLLVALVLLMIGIVVARIIRSFLTTAFRKINLDSLLDKIGLGPVFARMGLRSGPSVFLPKLLYWIVVLFVLKIASEAAGIKDISEIILAILAYSPRVFTAVIILLIGFVVADLVGNAVQRALDSFGLEYAGTLAKIVFGFIFILVLTVALNQLGIETELLNATVKIILIGLAAALALALGLGLKNLAHDVVAGVYVRDLYKVGTELEIGGEPAKIAGVGPITTKLQRRDGGFIMVPNHQLVSTEVRGRGVDS